MVEFLAIMSVCVMQPAIGNACGDTQCKINFPLIPSSLAPTLTREVRIVQGLSPSFTLHIA